MKKGIFTKIFLILLIIFAGYILFKDLGKAVLDNWDESWYAEVVKQVIKTRDFIILRWNGEVFLEKPPMYIWLSAISTYIFGLSEFSARLTSALSALAIIAAVLYFSFKKWGLLASFLAFLSIALNNVFIWRSRSGNIDTFVALLIFSVFLLIQSKNKNKYIFLGILFGLIYLTKLSLVFFPLIIFVLHEVIYKRSELKKNMSEYIKLFVIFIGISGFWLLLGYARMGGEFVRYYMLNSDQGAFRLNFFNFKLDYWEYAYYSLQRRYFYIFILGIFFLVKGIRKSENFLILFFSLSLLFLLSFSGRNNNWYLIPSMPFWALAIGLGARRLFQMFQHLKVIQLVILLAIFYISYKTFNVNILSIMNTNSTIDQAQSSRIIKELSKNSDTVIRLDQLYPTAIYYSDRKILASPVEANTEKYFISRVDVSKGIESKKFSWLFGTRADVKEFIRQNMNFKLKEIDVNKSESIIQVI